MDETVKDLREALREEQLPAPGVSRGAFIEHVLDSSSSACQLKGTVLLQRKARGTTSSICATSARHIDGYVACKECMYLCLGLLTLKHVYHYSGALLSHLLFKSWAETLLSAALNRPTWTRFAMLAEKTLKAIPRLHVQHHDTEPPNVIFDMASRNPIAINFKRSTSVSRLDLASMSSNSTREMTTRKGSRHQSAEGELASWAIACVDILNNVHSALEKEHVSYIYRGISSQIHRQVSR